jgi:hypothetical protein
MKETRNIGKKVIVRSDRAGVFFGTLAEKQGDEVILTKARKLHTWYGAFAVEELALNGTSKPENCRFTVFVEEITIMQVIQIIPCAEESIISLESVKEWKK